MVECAKNDVEKVNKNTVKAISLKKISKMAKKTVEFKDNGGINNGKCKTYA